MDHPAEIQRPESQTQVHLVHRNLPAWKNGGNLHKGKNLHQQSYIVWNRISPTWLHFRVKANGQKIHEPTTSRSTLCEFLICQRCSIGSTRFTYWFFVQTCSKNNAPHLLPHAHLPLATSAAWLVWYVAFGVALPSCHFCPSVQWAQWP